MLAAISLQRGEDAASTRKVSSTFLIQKAGRLATHKCCQAFQCQHGSVHQFKGGYCSWGKQDGGEWLSVTFQQWSWRCWASQFPDVREIDGDEQWAYPTSWWGHGRGHGKEQSCILRLTRATNWERPPTHAPATDDLFYNDPCQLSCCSLLGAVHDGASSHSACITASLPGNSSLMLGMCIQPIWTAIRWDQKHTGAISPLGCHPLGAVPIWPPLSPYPFRTNWRSVALIREDIVSPDSLLLCWAGGCRLLPGVQHISVPRGPGIVSCSGWGSPLCVPRGRQPAPPSGDGRGTCCPIRIMHERSLVQWTCKTGTSQQA